MVLIRKGSNFYGFVTAGGRRYTFELIMSENYPRAIGSLNVDWRLKTRLGEALNTFLKEHDKFDDPDEFYRYFETFVQSNLKTCETAESWLQHPSKAVFLVQSLQQEIKKAGEYIKDFDLKTGLVEIEVTDCQFRTHKAVLKLSQNYKNEPVSIVSHDLPQLKVGMELNPDLSNIFSIAEFCERFSELVTCFQQFWNLMSLLDTQCCILDPANPTFKDIFRRIKVNNLLSVALTFNPFCPNQRPKIKLLGRQTEVNQFEEVLQKNLENDVWDNEEDVLFNLSNVLEVSLPSKIFEDLKTSDSVEEGECAICFTWRLNDEIPNEMCENSSCKSVYHSSCLFTYFSSIPRNRDYFGIIQGECPNCDHSISCTVPKLM